MKRVIKIVYTTFYQKSIGISYREQVIFTLATIGFMLAVIIPLVIVVMMS